MTSFNSDKNRTIFSAGVDIVDIVDSLLNVYAFLMSRNILKNLKTA